MKRDFIFHKVKGAERFLAALLCLVLMLSMLSASLVANASETPIATLFFASDYQDESGDGLTPSTTLTSILNQAKSDGKNIDHAVFCGDFSYAGSNYTTNVVADINEVKGIIDTELGTGVHDTYLQGNHDLYDSGLMSPTGAYEYDDYIIYVINTQGGHNTTGGNPWKQGSTNSKSIVQAAADDLRSYLNGRITAGDTRPIFIATHVPLHMTSRTSSLYGSGDNMYSSYLFDVINEAGSSLDIVFLYGHNHSHGWDSYIGGSSVYLKKGDTIYIPDSTGASGTTNNFTNKTLTFTYMNAGYLGYNTGTTADSTLTGSVVEIYGDKLVITRYDTSGIHKLGSAGSYNTTSDGERYNDANGFGGGQPYACVAQNTASPQRVTLKNISTDVALRLVGTSSTADIAESDNVTAVLTNVVGASDITYTWTTSDASVAKLLSNSGETVTVDYLKKGTATVTCTASYKLDGVEKSLTKNYTVTVTAEVATGSGNTYTLVTDTTNLDGSEYLILYNDGYNDGYIVEPSIITTSSRTGLRNNLYSVPGAGNATIQGDYSAYEWTLNVNNNSDDSARHWTVQGSNVSGNNYLRFETSSDYPASFVASGSASRFRITFDGSYANFRYTNSSQNNYTSLYNLMQKDRSRGIVYGYDVTAGTINFYLYKAVSSETSMNITTADGNEPAASYDEATTAIFKASVENIGEITSFAWTSSDESVISFSNSSAEKPTVNFLKDGTATVSLTLTYVKDGVTQTLTDSVTITVNNTLVEPEADILRGSRVVTNVMQRRYSVTSSTTDQLTASYSGINNAVVTWTSSNTQVAQVSSSGALVFTGHTGYTSITMTVTGTDTDGNPVTLTRVVSYYADSGSASAATNDYPSYPDEGSVKVDKYASSVDFATTGVAEVTLELDGISSIKPLDIVMVLDMSSSMKGTVDGKTRVSVMNESLHGLVQDLLSDNPDGTASENRLAFVAFNNYDYTKISTNNTIAYNYNGENSTGFNYTEYGTNPIFSGDGTVENCWEGQDKLNQIEKNIDIYINEAHTTSGTNYDIAFMTAYNILEEAQKAEGYSREQVVIFLSDGCPFQWNYFRGHNGFQGSGKGTAWMTWLDGTYNVSSSSNSYASNYFNANGKNWWAEAIKATTDNNKVIDPKNGTSGNSYLRNVSGLGATIYSLGYCLAQDREITVAAQQRALQSVASSNDKVYYANNGSDLQNVFSDIKGNLVYAATNSVVTDTLGSEYDLQFSSNISVKDGIIDLSGTGYIGKAPYIEFGRRTLDNERNAVDGSYQAVETVTFETDGAGALTAAYSSLNPGVNIYDSSTGIIDAVNFDYNVTTETFTWNVGTLYDNVRYELSYFVSLNGAREGERDAGSYPTNMSAVVDYTNYLGHDARQVFPVPYMPWKAANITYELYLVNTDGQPINENGIIVPFANRVTYYTNTVTVHLNNQNEVPDSEIVAANAIPDGYELFNNDTAYFISIGSGSNLSYAYVCDDGTPQTTFVYQPAGASYTGGTYNPSGSDITYNLKVDGINDYSNTHVAFAVVAVPELTERSVKKVWNHKENPEESRPTYVTVQLKANGENYGDPIVLNASNNWSYSWDNLNRYVYSNGVATDSEVVYSIEEISVPEGYTVSYSPADGNGLITVTNTYSTETYYALQITKTNDSEPTKYLNGAGFRLYTDESCTTEFAEYYLDAALTQKVPELVDSAVVTDSTGKISFYALVAGEYYIYEFRAPTGYERLSSPLKLTIAEDGTATVTTASGSYGATVSEDNTISITLTNRTLNVDIPFTAGFGAYWFIGIGVLLMGTACVLFAVIRRRRNNCA